MSGIRSAPEDGTMIRVATWNLARVTPRSWARLPRMEREMRGIDADIWILTGDAPRRRTRP